MKHEDVLTDAELTDFQEGAYAPSSNQFWYERLIEQALLTKLAEKAQPVALPFAILDDELAALRRFDECASDGEGYDVPKEMMGRLAEIGLLRRMSGNYYEHTTFGLSVLNGDFAAPSALLEAAENACDFLRLVASCEGDLCKAEEVADKLQFAIEAHKKGQA